jgi:hypothetical protein
MRTGFVILDIYPWRFGDDNEFPISVFPGFLGNS